MRRLAGTWLTILLAAAGGIPAAGCCPTTSGPTGPAVQYSATLGPGEFRYYDIETPRSTTQINLQFRLDSLTIPLRVRQIDPACLPSAEDSCETFYDHEMPPRTAGVYTFGNSLQPYGTRTRVVLQNRSADASITYSVTITPHQAGCD